MRTLLEIIEECKDGGKPEYEELRYALLVYNFMFNMDHKNLIEELSREKETAKIIREMRLKNTFDMAKNALNKSPKEYLGWNNDPENPEYQKFRQIAQKVFDKAVGQTSAEGVEGI